MFHDIVHEVRTEQASDEKMFPAWYCFYWKIEERTIKFFSLENCKELGNVIKMTTEYPLKLFVVVKPSLQKTNTVNRKKC